VNQNYQHVTQPPASQKEVKALDYRLEKVEKEMAECNFKPTLTAKQTAVAKSKLAAPQVNGLQRFYELRDL